MALVDSDQPTNPHRYQAKAGADPGAAAAAAAAAATTTTATVEPAVNSGGSIDGAEEDEDEEEEDGRPDPEETSPAEPVMPIAPLSAGELLNEGGRTEAAQSSVDGLV
jgi:hypothetical protein